MSTSSLQDTVASIGFAKVIVALKGVPGGAAAASAQTKSSIENHFMIPNLAQAKALRPQQATSPAASSSGRSRRRRAAFASIRILVWR